MKQTTFLTYTIMAIMSISCNKDELKKLQSELDNVIAELEDCQYELEEAQDKISTIEDYSYKIHDEMEELSSEIEDFGWEDWRYNVWDVENEANDLRGAIEELRNEF